MLALVAAVLFLVALVLSLVTSLTLGPVTATVLTIAGFMFVALYMAGIGKRSWR